jgi:hypothetical protein
MVRIIGEGQAASGHDIIESVERLLLIQDCDTDGA